MGIFDWLSKKEESAETYFNTGFKHFKRGRYDKAKIEFNKAIELDPNHKEALACLGQIFIGEGDDKKAVAVLEKAAQLYEDDADPMLYFLLGSSYGCLNQYHKAAEAFKKAIAIDPKGVEAHKALVLAYGTIGQYEDARRTLDNFLSLSPAKEHLDDIILWLTKQFIESINTWTAHKLGHSVFQIVKLIDGTSIDASQTSTGKHLVSKGLKLRMGVTQKAETLDLLPYFLAGFEILKTSKGAEREVARCLQNIGWVCLNLGWFEYAIKLNKEALNKFSSIPDSSADQAMCKETIGSAYGHLGKPEEEKKWKLEAMDGFFKADPKQMRREAAIDLSLFEDKKK